MLRRIQQDEIDGFYKELYLPYIEELKYFGGSDGMSENLLRYNLCNTHMGAFEIVKAGKAVGFAITEKVAPPDIYIPMLFLAEFGIRKGCRRQGVGTAAFKEILSSLETPLFFTVLPKNKAASAFWRRQIAINELVPVSPDSGQIRFATGSDLYCFRKGCL